MKSPDCWSQAAGPGCPSAVSAISNPSAAAAPVLAEVVGFRGEQTLLMPLADLRGVGLGSQVVALAKEAHYPVGPELLGRVIDGLGRPIDGKGVIAAHSYPVYRATSNPLDREEIHEPLDIGIRAINGMITCGKGQRVAILAGAGVGKSTLLAMIARNTRADVKIIALIGERGREVEEFVARTLPSDERERMIVVAATSEAPALVRVRGAFIATTIAEYFRDSRPGRSAIDGFAEPLCHGAAGSGAGGGRAALHQGLYAVGVRVDAAPARAGGKLEGDGEHNGALHRAHGRR